MVNVTLIGKKQAKEGQRFIYMGPLSECRDCKVKTVCFNLDVGRVYKITKIRDMVHGCKIHEGGVRAVEYETDVFKMVIDSRSANEGAIITLSKPELCNNLACTSYILCQKPDGFKADESYKVVAVDKDVRCEMGKDLKEVTLEYDT